MLFKRKKAVGTETMYYDDSLDYNLDGDYDDLGEYESTSMYEVDNGRDFGLAETLFWILISAIIYNGIKI